jgi:hypothetical protein
VRVIHIAVSICLVLIVAAYAFSRPLSDFVEYWTSAHLLIAHQNPYSLPNALEVQQTLGWGEPFPLIPLNPPWVLVLIAPLGLTNSYALAWLLWVAILTCAVAASSRMLMDVYFGELRIPDISDSGKLRCLMAFTFYPTLLSIKFAQTAPLLLLGIAGFLYFEKKGRFVLAGIFLSLTLVKPQLVILIWLALVLAFWRRHLLQILIPAMAIIATLTAIAMFLDNQIFRQYWEIIRGPYAQVYPSGMMAIFRRALGGRNTFWLQFLLPVIGIAWLAAYWWRHRWDWNWGERVPMLVTVSMFTTAWGWLFDQALLSVPIIALAAQYARAMGVIPRNPVILYTALNILLILAAMFSSPWSFVPAPVLVAVLLIRDARSSFANSMDARPAGAGVGVNGK